MRYAMEAIVKKSRLYIFFDSVEKYICIVALSVMLLVVFWQVVNRFVFNNANSWSEELARSLNVLLVYVSCSYGVRFKDHIKIDILICVFPRSARPFVSLIGEILMLVFFTFLAVKGFQLAASVMAVNRVTGGLGINAGYLYLPAPVGFALSAIRMLENWAEQLYASSKERKAGGAEGEGGAV
jgi:TRAP-type C4-dicarboxylate transport system permease small subunit